KAKPVLEQVLRASPGDEHAEMLLRLVSSSLANASPSLDDALAEIESRRALSEAGNEACKIFEPAPRSSAPPVTPAQLDGFLVGYEPTNGDKCPAVLSGDGACVAAHTRGMVPREKFTSFLQNIYQCSEDASRKMDSGTFVSGELDTSVGRLAMAE